MLVLLQDMSYQHRELLGVQAGAVSSSCLASLQQPMGILLLEESLLRGPAPPDEPPSKRARGRRELPPDTERWIHLAKYATLASARFLHVTLPLALCTRDATFVSCCAETI